MKQLIILQLISTFFMLLITGCKKECAEWYEGDKCERETRSKYFGNYEGKITTRNDVTGEQIITYDNFYINSSLECINCLSIDNEYYIELSDGNKFTLPIQNMQSSNYVIKTGEGAFFDDEEVFLNLQLSNPENVSISFSGIKQ